MHDGPGVRTTVFLKGCPLRCAWCHNPETQKFKSELLFYPNKCIGCGACAASCLHAVHSLNEQHLIDREKCVLCGKCVENCPTGALEICGKELSIEAILSVVKKDQAFYEKNGGVTLSGGEPFAQGEAVTELLKACKKSGFSTAVETCGYADSEIIRTATPYIDLFLWDIKDTNSARHKRYTGVDNDNIFKNLSLVNQTNAKIRLRCILTNGINTDEHHYTAISELASKINNLDGVELIPYHAYGGTKAVFLGGKENGRKEWIPTVEEINRAKSILEAQGICVYHSVTSLDKKAEL